MGSGEVAMPMLFQAQSRQSCVQKREGLSGELRKISIDPNEKGPPRSGGPYVF